MKFVSRWALASFISLPVAGVIYLLGRLEAHRMEAEGKGFKMADALSPLVFFTIDAVLIFGGVVGFVGFILGPGVSRRVQAAVGVLACVGSFLVLPWR
jgi:hypothetical protein